MKAEFIPFLIAAALAFSCGKEGDEDDLGLADDTIVADNTSGSWRHSNPGDVTSPPMPVNFSVASGPWLGQTTMVLAYPEATGDYARIDFRRKAGTTAPEDCSDGTLALSVADLEENTFIDNNLYPGDEYSYRACFYDAAGNETSVVAQTVGTAGTRHRVFVTSQMFDGNLTASFDGQTFTDGIDGANYRCQYLADEAGLNGKFKAVLSRYYSYAAYYRLPIYGKIYNNAADPELVAAGRADFYDSGPSSAVKYDESGAAVAVTRNEFDAPTAGTAWSGSTSSGFSWTSCNNWTSNSASEYGFYGDPEETEDGTWLSYSTGSCDNEMRLYCLETLGMTITPPTLTTEAGSAAGDVDYAIDFPANLDGYGSVSILRQQGATFANDTCLAINTYNYGASVRSYSGLSYSPFVDGSFTDSSTDGEGIYNYAACVRDKHGNLVVIVNADPVTTGTDFKRAFITSTTYDGNLGGVAGANAKCATAASSASLGGTWEAIIADSSNGISNNITVNKNTYDLNDNFVMDDTTDLTTTSALLGYKSIATDENGDAVAEHAPVWTGTNDLGGASANSCSDWSSANSGMFGTYGLAQYATGISWKAYAVPQTCDQLARLYCIEQ